MIVVEDMRSVGDLIQFAAWVLVVVGLRRAVFASFLARELGWRRRRRESRRMMHLQRLRWEINHRTRYDARVEQGDPLTAPQPLTDEEVAARGREFEALAVGTLWARAWAYFLECAMCQSFWLALLLIVVFGRAGLAAAVVSALAYGAVAATIESQASAFGPRPAGPRGAATPGCMGCGEK